MHIYENKIKFPMCGNIKKIIIIMTNATVLQLPVFLFFSSVCYLTMSSYKVVIVVYFHVMVCARP